VAVAHDLFSPEGDSSQMFEAEANDIDVGAGAPGGAGVFAVGVAEGDVDAGNFSSWRMLPMTRSTPRLVPMATSAHHTSTRRVV